MADLHGWFTDRYVISRRADEADIGETSHADLRPPPPGAPGPPQGPGKASPH